MKTHLVLITLIFISISNIYSQEYKTYDNTPKSNSDYIKPIKLNPLKNLYVDVNGLKLNAQIHHNENIKIVFLPGYGSTQKYWYNIISQLDPTTGILTYDRTGYGESEFADNYSDAKSSAIQLNDLLFKIGIQNKVLIVSHSYGAHIARLYTYLFPEKVSGLILIEEPHENLRIEMEKILKPNELSFYHMINSEMEKMPTAHQGMQAETQFMKETFEQLRNAKPMPEVPCFVLSAGDKKSFNEFSAETKTQLKQLEFNLQKEIAKLIPNTKHYIINNSGHNLPLDQPKAVLDAINELIKKGV